MDCKGSQQHSWSVKAAVSSHNLVELDRQFFRDSAPCPLRPLGNDGYLLRSELLSRVLDPLPANQQCSSGKCAQDCWCEATAVAKLLQAHGREHKEPKLVHGESLAGWSVHAVKAISNQEASIPPTAVTNKRCSIPSTCLGCEPANLSVVYFKTRCKFKTRVMEPSEWFNCAQES